MGGRMLDACEGLQLCIDSISTVLFQAVGHPGWAALAQLALIGMVRTSPATRSRCFSSGRFRKTWQHDPTTQSSDPWRSAAEALPLADGFENRALGSHRRPTRRQLQPAVQSHICNPTFWDA